MKVYNFEENFAVIQRSLETLDMECYKVLLHDCEVALRKGKKIILSGLGKNVPVCQKIVSSMLSASMDAAFLHTDEAFHGDLGLIKDGDVVIVFSKSGKTPESMNLANYISNRKDIRKWAFTFMNETEFIERFDNAIVLQLEKEGDPWGIMPMNSTVISLIVMQGVIVDLVNRLEITLLDFKTNHPGGGIGLKLAQK